MKRPSVQKIIINIIVVIILIALIIMAFRGRGTDTTDYTPALYGTFLSLLPPVVAIVLALITKEVYSSLFAGIIVGGLLYAGGNAEHAFNTILYHEEAGLVPNLTDLSHVSVLVFVVLLGTLVVLMNRSGSAQAFGRWAEKHIKTRVGAQLATILMGILIFVDDGFNCMTVGSVMRPMTDSHKISRAKLAYLLDSTAAPICIIAPISCWAAAVSYAAHKYENAAFVSGNAPTCLLRLVELMEEGYRPAFVIGVPVGFVNVVESKVEIMDICRQYDVPAIVAMGQKGGSNVAAAICNAILYTACDTIDPKSRGWL